jgi:RNA polymerase sigma-70 factor (ECF subfamily)
MEQRMIMAEVEEAWAALRAPLLRFVRRRVPDAASAEDIVQDTFVKMTSQLHTLRRPEALQRWAYQIARRAIIDYYRARPLLEPLPPTLPTPEVDADNQRLTIGRCLRGLIAALPPSSREALLLTDVHGLSQRELAARLGLSFSGAKARVQRARTRLKALLLACCNVQLDQRGSPVSCAPRDPDCCASACCDQLCCAA